MNRKKLKQAFAGFDEINTFWVAKMDIPDKEKALRVEMMNDFAKRLSSVPQKKESKRKFDNLMLAVLGYVAYKTLYLEFVDKYYKRYVQTVGANGSMANFAEYWINNHAEVFANYSHIDVQTMARTETNALCSLGQLDSYMQMGYERKMWVTMGDKKVRQTHRDAAGQIVLLEEPFLVGDSYMMFPQDSSLGASASEIVNCRCSMRPVK